VPIWYQKRIYRKDLVDNPEVFFVFGDNLSRRGFGGQAKEMRGEPNAIGVATKRYPSMTEASFFSDAYYDEIIGLVETDLQRVERVLKQGHDVVWPEDGIGSGLSQMPERCPRLWAWLESERKRLERVYRNEGLTHTATEA